MSIIISTAAGVMYPALGLGHSRQRANRNVVHELMGAAGVAFTLHDAAAHSGSLVLLFPTTATAVAADLLHSQSGIFVYTDDKQPALNMSYIVTGPTSLDLDPTTRVFWTLSVPFQRVTP